MDGSSAWSGTRQPATRWIEPGDDVLEVLAGADNPIVVAGPGVVVAGAVADLHALAASASLGVLNTWGAKGVFDWRSRHHLATAGLQVRDFELGGLQAADVVLATGVDPLEAPDALLAQRPARVVDVEPGALGPLAERWHRPHQPIEVPALRSALAAVTEDGWRAEGTPMAPSRATWHYGQVAAGGRARRRRRRCRRLLGGPHASDAELGSVVVPAERSPASPPPAASSPGSGTLAAPCSPSPTRSQWRCWRPRRALGVAIPVEVWSRPASPRPDRPLGPARGPRRRPGRRCRHRRHRSWSARRHGRRGRTDRRLGWPRPSP